MLRGRFGVRYVEVNAFGIPIRTLSKKESTEGSKISLTIDLRLQGFIANRIKDVVASVTVLDVKTGEIIAMVSTITSRSMSGLVISVRCWIAANLAKATI